MTDKETEHMTDEDIDSRAGLVGQVCAVVKVKVTTLLGTFVGEQDHVDGATFRSTLEMLGTSCARIEAVEPVVRAARRWRHYQGSDLAEQAKRAADLVAAVDALTEALA